MSTEMSVKEYAKYVIDKIQIAAIGNTLNISKKFIDKDFDFVEFLESAQEYVVSLLNQNFSKDKCYRILVLISDSLKKYKSTEAVYNKSFIYNNFVVTLWLIMTDKEKLAYGY